MHKRHLSHLNGKAPQLNSCPRGDVPAALVPIFFNAAAHKAQLFSIQLAAGNLNAKAGWWLAVGMGNRDVDSGEALTRHRHKDASSTHSDQINDWETKYLVGLRRGMTKQRREENRRIGQDRRIMGRMGMDGEAQMRQEGIEGDDAQKSKSLIVDWQAATMPVYILISLAAKCFSLA
eukprot:612058-Pelagomonas_calceolata.AAC.1